MSKAGVRVLELVARVIPVGHAEGPAPILGVGDGQGAGVEGRLVVKVGTGLGLGRRAGEEGIVGPLRPSGHLHGGLRDEAKAQYLQSRADELCLRLGFVELSEDSHLPLV